MPYPRFGSVFTPVTVADAGSATPSANPAAHRHTAAVLAAPRRRGGEAATSGTRAAGGCAFGARAIGTGEHDAGADDMEESGTGGSADVVVIVFPSASCQGAHDPRSAAPRRDPFRRSRPAAPPLSRPSR